MRTILRGAGVPPVTKRRSRDRRDACPPQRVGGAVVACAALALCVACATTVDAPAVVDNPLVGAWRGPVPPGGAECPFDLDVFADGSAEVNYVDDDSDEEKCGFVRVPWTVSGDVLRLGGAATCRHRLDRDATSQGGDLLTIACEDHGEPPANLQGALVLRRREVRELHGQSALAGRWTSAPIFGNKATLSLDANGHGSMGDQMVELVAKDDRTATIKMESGTAGCIYRATKEKLTLRCANPGEGAPSSFVDGPGTVVMLRAP